MLLILSTLFDLTDCYQTNTTLQISEVKSQLILLLNPSDNILCTQFPLGVKVQLIFSNQTLDVQKIVTNFNYTTTIQINIDVPSIEEYFDIILAQFRIKSYDFVYDHQLQEIIITKNDQLQVFENFVVNYDQKVFNCNVTYPKTFTSMTIIDAWINSTDYLQSYIIQYDGVPIVDLTTHFVSLNFPNAEISPTLYANGIVTISIHITYGDDVFSIGDASTNILTYKDQPASGLSLEFRIFQNSIFTSVEPSSYFMENLIKYPSVGILYSINRGLCGFYENFSPASILLNLKQNNNTFASLMNGIMFPNNIHPDDFSLDYQGCINFGKKNGTEMDLSFIFENDQGLAQNRITFHFDKIQRSKYEDVHLKIDGNQMVVQGKLIDKDASLTVSGYYKIKLFRSQKDFYFNSYEEIIEKQVRLEGDLDIVLDQQSKQIISLINKAYFIIMEIYDKQDQLLDELQLTIFENSQLQFILYNLLIAGVYLTISSIIGVCIILLKPKQVKKKIKVNKVLEDEIV